MSSAVMPSPLRQSARKRTLRNSVEILDIQNNNNSNVHETVEVARSSRERSVLREEESSPRGRDSSFLARANGDVRVGDQTPAKKEGKGVQRSKSPSNQAKKAGSPLRRALRVFVKWTILLMILSGIAYAFKSVGSKMLSERSAASNVSEFVSESQIVELEKFLKKTTKMLQVQLELVDIKYGKEIEKVKKELEESIKDHASELYAELKSLKEHAGDIEESLKALKDSGFSRDDVEALVNKIVDNRAAEGEGRALSLDDVRAVARNLVEAEIERHAADGLGMVDYAIRSGGSKVVQHSEGFYSGKNVGWSVSSVLGKSGSLHPHASKMLEPSFGEPGQCLPLKGSKVFVDIGLRTNIFVKSVTLEHVAKSVAFDRSSAPKDFRIFGWLDQLNEKNVDETAQMFLLGEFTYDLEKSNAQTFNVPIESAGKLVNMIKLDVLSNHGSSSHTCIYRFRVHGSEPEVKPTSNEYS